MDAMPMLDPAAEAAPADLSQGYTVEVSVLPDGTFKVSGPEPLQVEAGEEQGAAGSEVGSDYQSIADALKGIIKIIKSNPVGGGADIGQKQFDAGYNS